MPCAGKVLVLQRYAAGKCGACPQPGPCGVQESGALRDYLLFAAAAGVSGGWFVLHHHWHLDIHLGAWSLQHACVVLIAGMALALALPGLAVCGGPRSLTGAVGAAQVRPVPAPCQWGCCVCLAVVLVPCSCRAMLLVPACLRCRS